MFKKEPHNTKGFTLIEILVVMSIISVLISAIGGNYITSRIRARDAERKSAVSQIQRAAEIYYNDHGMYPEAQGGRINGIAWGNAFTDDAGTIYMVQLPTDPRAPDVEYFYESNSPLNTKYRIYTRLENEDDIDTDHDDDGIAGEEYDVFCATKLCNFGVASPSTTMEEIW